MGAPENVLPSLKCGRAVILRCAINDSCLFCVAPCERQLLPSGHLCAMRFFFLNFEMRTLVPPACPVVMTKTLLSCQSSPEHFKDTRCSEKVSTVACNKRCNTTLPCSHTCRGFCGECNVSVGTVTTLRILSKYNCKRRLAWNHLCPGHHECRKSKCLLCQQSCAVICSHARCVKPCSEPSFTKMCFSMRGRAQDSSSQMKYGFATNAVRRL